MNRKGTSIHANYQVNERGARFFRFRPDWPEEKEYIHLPIEASMITSIIADKSGTIWAMADGTLVSYNPETKEIKTKQILDLISGRFRNAKIIEGIDGKPLLLMDLPVLNLKDEIFSLLSFWQR